MSLISRIKQHREAKPVVHGSKPIRKRTVAAAPSTEAMPSDNIAQDGGFVKKCVMLADSAPEESRQGSAFVHISALVGDSWCPRANLLASRHAKAQSECVLPQMRIVWALGRAAETHVRNQFIKMHGRHRCIGAWRCVCEQTTHVGPGINTAICPTCQRPADIYGELTVLDEAIGKVGNPDLIFIAEDGGWEVLEIKSLVKHQFETLFMAKPDHVKQCRGYVRVLRQKMPGLRIAGRVFYVAKDYVRPGLSPYLEFPIGDSAADDALLQVLDDSVADMRVHETAGTLPARLPICGSPHATRAKNCTMCNLCFSFPNQT